jgi:hypothetical protein
MNLRPQKQPELYLAADGGEDGYAAWQEQRRALLNALAHKLGLPLGHRVEVWLTGGIWLRGQLRLREAKLFLDDTRHTAELEVDGVVFRPAEVESCVRLD